MSAGFLNRLIDRSMGTVNVIQPLLPSRYSPVQSALPLMHFDDVSADKNSGIAGSTQLSLPDEPMTGTVILQEQDIVASKPLSDDRTVPAEHPGEKQDFQSVHKTENPIALNERGVQDASLPERERGMKRTEPGSFSVEKEHIISETPEPFSPEVSRLVSEDNRPIVSTAKLDKDDAQTPTVAEIAQGTAVPSGIDREDGGQIVHVSSPVALKGGRVQLEVKPRSARKELPPLVRQTSKIPIPASPDVQVTIGKIELRAVRQEAPQMQRQQVPQAQHLTLDEYLKRWDGCGR